MSNEIASKVLIVLLILGLLAAIYFLVKDRVEILRSLKPKNLAAFFGLDHKQSDPFGSIILFTILNVMTLFIWVPFWVLHKIFKLNIFEKNNSK